MKRFWDKATVAAADGGFQVLLDGKPMRVPGGAALTLPTEALAVAVAAEWQGARADFSVADLPLTRIAGTGQERIAPNPEPVVLELAKYAESDLLCYRAPAPPALAERQHDAWQPWLEWADRRHGARLLVTQGVTHTPQPTAALAALAAAVAGFSPVSLAALGVAVPALGSLVLALALADGALPAAEAHALSILDELFQEEQWGLDDEAAARRKNVADDLAAAGRMLDLVR
jgi:chaperone required for assembly of F1-ATPase